MATDLVGNLAEVVHSTQVLTRGGGKAFPPCPDPHTARQRPGRGGRGGRTTMEVEMAKKAAETLAHVAGVVRRGFPADPEVAHALAAAMACVLRDLERAAERRGRRRRTAGPA